MIFETHAHYDDERFDPDRDVLLSNMRHQGIGPIINVGASMESARESVRLAHSYEDVYAAVGVHPSDVGDLTEADMDELIALSDDEKVVSIGEIGLDYYWDKEEDIQSRQRKWFVRQLEVAEKCDLPVIIHSREAAADTMDIMRDASKRGIRGVIHCYSYSLEQALEYVHLGYYIGVGGVVTFKNAKKLKETVENIPLERILLETDSPYLAPDPFRGRRNDSTYLPYVIRQIANLREITEDEVVEATTRNAYELFSRVGASSQR